MKLITDTKFGGERPLFDAHQLELQNVVFEAGESALKFASDIVADNCRFEGKYPFWHAERFEVRNCLFTPGGRAALWYSKNCKMRNCTVDAPKMFREMQGIDVTDTTFSDAQETLWHCRGVGLRNVVIKNADYLFMHSHAIDIADYEQHGNYSFQYCTGVNIINAKIYSKDAFWGTKGVTVVNSELHGEYLGWHSDELTLVNCHISGTQPLCYCKNLKLINCTFDADADLAFEDSDLEAVITSEMTSIKNPRHGFIRVPKVGEVIIDEHLRAPGDCKIYIKEAVEQR